MGEQGRPVLHHAPDGIFLVRVHLPAPLLGDTRQYLVSAIKNTRPVVIEFVVILGCQAFGSVRVLPDPFLEFLLNQFGLFLCGNRFLRITYRMFLTILTLNLVIDFHQFAVKDTADDFIGLHALRAIGFGLGSHIRIGVVD